jgi:hypothetical protein
MTRQNLIAATGAATGWIATLTLHEVAAAFAGFATGVWMIAQTITLIRRQRCTNLNCQNRQP